jgi:hypothetical protein
MQPSLQNRKPSFPKDHEILWLGASKSIENRRVSHYLARVFSVDGFLSNNTFHFHLHAFHFHLHLHFSLAHLTRAHISFSFIRWPLIIQLESSDLKICLPSWNYARCSSSARGYIHNTKRFQIACKKRIFCERNWAI